MTTATKILLIALLVGLCAWFAVTAAAALTPFLLASVLAYVVSPLAGKLERRGLSPGVVATLIVFALLMLILLTPFALLPLILAQVRELLELLPPLVAKIQTWLGSSFTDFLKEQQPALLDAVDMDGVKNAASFLSSIFGGGLRTLAEFFSVLLITPLVTFYLLRDRKSIGGQLTEIIPPATRERALLIARDLDDVLGEFLHGQLLVMLLMSAYYAIALKLVGLNFALTIGVISGILVFIPYVGFVLGISLATLVALGEFNSIWDLVIIWFFMGVGTTVESVIITPRLVGERIGLHPVAVLLALVLMGEWFGFAGLLLALPLAAVFLVCCRHLRRRYINSKFYGRS